MWAVVYIAPRRDTALELKEFLAKEGILAITRPVGYQMAGDGGNYEVLVSESEAEDALALLNAILQKNPD